MAIGGEQKRIVARKKIFLSGNVRTGETNSYTEKIGNMGKLGELGNCGNCENLGKRENWRKWEDLGNVGYLGNSEIHLVPEKGIGGLS